VGNAARVIVSVHKAGWKAGVWRWVSIARPAAGASRAGLTAKLHTGTWRIRLIYINSGILTGRSLDRTVVIR